MTAPVTTGPAALASAIADRLDAPPTAAVPRWWPQSLAHGALGVALLHVERARAGFGPWRRAHDWLAYATRDAVQAGPGSHLHQGAPALAFVLNRAADRPGRYGTALDVLDRQIAGMTRRRIDRAYRRMDRGARPALAEFDAIRGLAGLGAYLLRRDPNGDLIRAVLCYLVRLTEPVIEPVTATVIDAGQTMPGWWTDVAPSGQASPDFPGGHANTGMAHGIAGPLALLALAMRDGVMVEGQRDAIRRIQAWLDRWRQEGATGVWWPYWITCGGLRAERPASTGPGRPSWCYGTAGIARAQQLAALALGDTDRQRTAEQALLTALTDPAQLALTTDLSLCHGIAGLAHIAQRAAADATSPAALADLAPRLLVRITEHDTDVTPREAPPESGPGLLEGAAGIALALHSASASGPVWGWDACLLIG